MLTTLIHLKRPFNRMKLRHELWKKKYPDSREKNEGPWTAVANASPEIKAHTEPKLDVSKLPFYPLGYID